MIITTIKESDSYVDNSLYEVWLNGGLVKLATYADDFNGIVVYFVRKNDRKPIRKIGRGKVKIQRIRNYFQ